MWTVLKFDKKNLALLKTDLYLKLGKNLKFYIPKIKIQKYKNNKLINKEINLLGDYLFCFHENLALKKTINSIKFIRGLKYFLNGFEFIKKILISLLRNANHLKTKKDS